MVREITTLYFEVIDSDLENLGQAVAAQNSTEIASLGHKIKGSSLTIGYDEIAGYASEIERLAKEERVQNACCQDLYELLQKAIATKRRSVLKEQ